MPTHLDLPPPLEVVLHDPLVLHRANLGKGQDEVVDEEDDDDDVEDAHDDPHLDVLPEEETVGRASNPEVVQVVLALPALSTVLGSGSICFGGFVYLLHFLLYFLQFLFLYLSPPPERPPCSPPGRDRSPSRSPSAASSAPAWSNIESFKLENLF